MNTERKVIKIPESDMDLLEYLTYGMGGQKQLIRFICEQEAIDVERLEFFSAKYNEIYAEYQVTLAAIIDRYAKDIDSTKYTIIPQFNLCALVIDRIGG